MFSDFLAAIVFGDRYLQIVKWYDILIKNKNLCKRSNDFGGRTNGEFEKYMVCFTIGNNE